VTVSNGVYSFEYGVSGNSNALTTESVATTNGTSTSFQKVLTASSVVAGSVSVSDGTYTWNQTNGSSNENEFGVAYSTSLRRVTATYYNAAPAAGLTIAVTYRTPASGISGALAGNNQPWIEISVNGTVQTPRQKVLAVPFAEISSKAISSKTVEGVLKTRQQRVDRFFTFHQIRSLPFQYTPVGTSTHSSTGFGGAFDSLPQLVSMPVYLPIPSRIVGLNASIVDGAVQTTSTGSYSLGKVTITLWHKSAAGLDEVLYVIDSGSAYSGGTAELSAILDKVYDGSDVLWITIDAPHVSLSHQGYGSLTVSGQLKINYVKVLFEQIEGN
jgi:hypothetical protein